MPGKRYTGSLAEESPEIAAEWARDLNHPDTPEKTAPRSGKPVQWRCKAGHVWKASVAQRTSALSGCPYCSGRLCLPEDSLASLEPGIAALWDHTGNSGVTPDSIGPGSGKRAHWKCPEGHEWVQRVQAIVRSRGYCAACNSLAFLYPDISRQWDWARNPGTPWDVAGASPSRRFWLCDKDPTHSWQATVASRTRQGTGCRQCANLAVSPTNNLQYLAPHLVEQFDVAGNGTTPDLVVATSTKRYLWICDRGPDHRWQATPANRYRNRHGCPYCAGKRPSVTNSLGALFPDIAAQFDSLANGLGPDEVVAGSNRKYQWRCAEGPDHVWKASPANRTAKNKGCPCCAGRQASITNSLESLHPGLAKELNPSLNGGITARDVVAGSNQPLTWQCSANEEHIWNATPNHRTARKKATGCPYCSGLKVLPEDSLAAIRPDIAVEWDREGNGSRSPDQVAPGSDYQASWICPAGHRYKARVDHRTRYGSGCGYAVCSLSPRSETEILLSFELSRFFRIDVEDLTVRGPQGEIINVDIKIPEEKLIVEFDGRPLA